MSYSCTQNSPILFKLYSNIKFLLYRDVFFYDFLNNSLVSEIDYNNCEDFFANNSFDLTGYFNQILIVNCLL